MTVCSETRSHEPSRVCPGCLTLSEEALVSCPHCHLSLNWLDGFPEFQAALCADWRVTLCLEVQSATGQWQREGELGVPQELVGVGDEAYRFVMHGPPYKLTVTNGNREFQIALPGRKAIAGTTIAARAVVAPPRDVSLGEIDDFRPGAIPLNVGTDVVLGREISSAPHVHSVPVPTVDMRHAVIVCQRERSVQKNYQTRNVYWIADLHTKTGTFVDGHPIVAKQLVGGEIVQIDQYAWVFNESDGFLVPVQGIGGIDVRLQNVAVKGRLDPLDLCLAPGTFVAVTGQSGAGKSTLMKAILGERISHIQGSIIAGGYDRDTDRERYRSQLGYVSQAEVVHADLSVEQAVHFSAELREKSVTEVEVRELLRRLDLPHRRWGASPSQLSGGESKRVRIATELIAEPKLLLLDEPASGLDQGREISLMRLLRGLSHQGCTVVLITHSLDHLDFCDRALIFHAGKLEFDGTPNKLRELIPSGNFSDLDLTRPPKHISERHSLSPSVPAPDSPRQGAHSNTKWSWGQWCVLLRREFSAIWSRDLLRWQLPVAGSRTRPLSIKWWILPLLVVPSFFAMALYWSVRPSDSEVLTFFCVLASIWMGASLSLLSIVNERALLEHELLLFLRLGPYVLAKTCALWLMSAVQNFVFVLMLWGMCSYTQGTAPDLPNSLSAASVLALVGCVAVGMGLFISAVATRSSAVANFILPLVMMVQIVFSVEVAGEGGNLDNAYGAFHTHRCEGCADCRQRVTHRNPTAGEWLCNECREAFLKCLNDSESSDRLHRTPSAEQRECITKKRIDTNSPEETDQFNQDLPDSGAIIVSYAAISRYGDIAMRSLYLAAKEDMDACGYGLWRRDAILTLLLMLLGFPAMTLIVLTIQTADLQFWHRSRCFLRWRGRIGQQATSLKKY